MFLLWHRWNNIVIWPKKIHPLWACPGRIWLYIKLCRHKLVSQNFDNPKKNDGLWNRVEHWATYPNSETVANFNKCLGTITTTMVHIGMHICIPIWSALLTAVFVIFFVWISPFEQFLIPCLIYLAVLILWKVCVTNCAVTKVLFCCMSLSSFCFLLLLQLCIGSTLSTTVFSIFFIWISPFDQLMIPYLVYLAMYILWKVCMTCCTMTKCCLSYVYICSSFVSVTVPMLFFLHFCCSHAWVVGGVLVH